MHIHTASNFEKNFEQHQMVNKILSQIAKEKSKSIVDPKNWTGE